MKYSGDFCKENNSVSFFKKHTVFAYLFMAAVIFAIFAIFLAVYGIYPFGEKTMSSYDMLAQVAPFIEHFYDVFSGKSSLFYTFAIAGGADVFGTLTFCALSPFTFVFLLFGEGNVYYATSIVLPLKIVCVAFAAFYYVKKRFKNINLYMQITLALSYAFCGYLYVSNTYISWVDLLIYLPFVAWGFRKIVCGEKKTTFVVSLCLMIYTCFSITSFSLFIIYPILILYAIIAVEKQERKRVVTDTVLALVSAVMFSLPVLLSSLAAFMVSGRRGGLFANMFNDLKADPLYYKMSYLFTDGITLFFTAVYFFKSGVKRPIDKFLLVAGGIVLMPVICDECCLLLNAGSYNSYALRFGFLNGFYFLFTASLYLNEFLYAKNIQEHSFEKIDDSGENEVVDTVVSDKPLDKRVFTPAFSFEIRNIAISILLTIFTLGIYGIYWMYLIVKNIHVLQKKDDGCLVEMLCLIFVPFYSLYWWYTRGESVKKEFKKQNYVVAGNGTIYLILGIFGLNIVSMAIIQNDFNSLKPNYRIDQKVINVLLSLCLSLLCIVAFLLMYYLFRVSQTELLSKYFSARFAHSLGGLEITAIMFAIVAIIALLTDLFVKKGKLSTLVASVILLVLSLGQFTFYGANLIKGNQSDVSKFSQIKVLTDYCKELDGNDYARIKTKSEYLTADMPFTLHTNSFTVFSSVIDDRNFVPTRFFGYGGNGNNTMKSHYGTFLGDCLFGYKYVISTDSYATSNLYRIEGTDKLPDKENKITVGSRVSFTYPDGDEGTGKVVSVSGSNFGVEPESNKIISLDVSDIKAISGELKDGAEICVLNGDFAGATGKITYLSKLSEKASVKITLMPIAKELCENIKDPGDFYLYKNLYAFPNAFKVASGEYDGTDKNLYERYTGILKMLGGNDGGLSELTESDITVAKAEGDIFDDDVYRVSIKRRNTGYYFIIFNFEKPEEISYSRSSYNKDNLKVLDAEQTVKMNEYSSSYNTVYLTKNSGAALDKQAIKDACKVYYLPDDTVKLISQKAEKGKGELKLSAGKITVDINAESGENLFLNYVALPGHTAYVNGKKTQMTDNYLGFMLVPLENGQNHVEITYNSPYLKLAAIGLIIALVYVVVYYFLAVRRKFVQNKLGGVLTVAAYALCTVVLLFFFVMPLFIGLYKLIMLGIRALGSLFKKA